jgi:hypothetical protein
LSEFSDENMMDPYNLAICFGPTLMPIPHSMDQVSTIYCDITIKHITQVYYHNYVAVLIKNIIVLHEHIFPRTLPGVRYDKFVVPLAIRDNHEDEELDVPIVHRYVSPEHVLRVCDSVIVWLGIEYWHAHTKHVLQGHDINRGHYTNSTSGCN